MNSLSRALFGVVALGVVAGLLAWEAVRLRSQRAERAAAIPTTDAPHYDCPEDRPAPPPRTDNACLNEITDEVGLDFVHTVGPLGTYFMPESTGAGAAFLDYNNDGRLDIYFVNCGQSPGVERSFPQGTRTENRLFRQTADGTFVDATQESGLGDTEYGNGVAVGDVDNDGLADVFLTNYGQDRLYRNNGNGTYTDITAAAGFNEMEWGSCAAMLDYDRDGWLDIMVVNYTADPTYGHSVACGFQHGTVSYCGPHKFQPTIDRLYHNEGLQSDGTGSGPATVRFRDVTAAAGLDQAATFGFGVICADLTQDGWPDMLVANDGAPNRFWVNQRNGTFLEEGTQRGLAVNRDGIAEAGMGVALGDVNRDLLPDLSISHLTKETTTLYVNSGAGLFMDQTQGSGLDKASMFHTGWGMAFVDLNHDGWLDLPLVHGLVVPCHSGFPFHGEDAFQVRRDVINDTDEYWKAYADENVLLLGRPGGLFQNNPLRGGDFCTVLASGRGLTYGDFDEDGDVDLLVTNCGTQARLYRNDLPKQGHWLKVRAVQAGSGRDALGARIIVRAGEQAWLQLVSPHTSYLASHDPRAHFGLGDTPQIDNIIVYWPDGPVESSGEIFPGGATNQVLTLQRGTGKPYHENQP